MLLPGSLETQRGVRVLAVALLCGCLASPAVGYGSAGVGARAPQPYTEKAVKLAFARERLPLFSEGRHSFGSSANPTYLTVSPGLVRTKHGFVLRASTVTVLVFASPSRARAALTAEVTAALRSRREPWVLRANLILVSRAPVLGAEPEWQTAKKALTEVR